MASLTPRDSRTHALLSIRIRAREAVAETAEAERDLTRWDDALRTARALRRERRALLTGASR